MDKGAADWYCEREYCVPWKAQYPDRIDFRSAMAHDKDLLDGFLKGRHGRIDKKKAGPNRCRNTSSQQSQRGSLSCAQTLAISGGSKGQGPSGDQDRGGGQGGQGPW